MIDRSLEINDPPLFLGGIELTNKWLGSTQLLTSEYGSLRSTADDLVEKKIISEEEAQAILSPLAGNYATLIAVVLLNKEVGESFL